MPTTAYGRPFADAYDALYADRDAAAEWRAARVLAARFGLDPTAAVEVLDVGCGTGRHAEAAVRDGCRVTAVDRAGPMIDIARRRLAGTGAEVVEADARALVEIVPGEHFGFAIALYDVLSHAVGDEEAVGVLAAVRRCLVPGGVFVADVLFGPGVQTAPPTISVRDVTGPDGVRRIRVGRPVYHRAAQVVAWSFQLLVLRGGRLELEAHEQQPLRCVFPRELGLLGRAAGLDFMGVYAPGAPDRPAAGDERRVAAVFQRAK